MSGGLVDTPQDRRRQCAPPAGRPLSSASRRECTEGQKLAVGYGPLLLTSVGAGVSVVER